MESSNKHKFLALIAVIISIAITTLMDLNGLGPFSAFPLILISLIFYFFNKPNKAELGLKWGNGSGYLIAFLYPITITVLTIILALTVFGETIRLSSDNKVYINLIAGTLIGPIMVLLTEEGFFRGWLWATLKKAGFNNHRILITTTLAFTIWHISAVTTGGSYGLPIHQVPVYLINVVLMGLVWGHLRASTKSVIIPTVCHSTWNAVIYGFFGFGEKVGALGFQQTIILGPEVGYLGIALNGLFYVILRKQYPLD